MRDNISTVTEVQGQNHNSCAIRATWSRQLNHPAWTTQTEEPLQQNWISSFMLHPFSQQISDICPAVRLKRGETGCQRGTRENPSPSSGVGRVVHEASLDVSWSTEEAERHLGFKIMDFSAWTSCSSWKNCERNHKWSELIYLLTLAFFYVREASLQTEVSTGRDSQPYQVSSTHLNPLLGVSGAPCGLQHHQQHHQAFSRRHFGIRRRSSAGEQEREPGLAELNVRGFI